ncbi:hypothetical protein THTE_3319 [Thermogutta terrifontis]|uniref:Uncharacterized protein n=1 Tax=Thermogutta terrifontis TaxID=1331910 RepID=A0A286RIX7_9BACT|nr:hypothetical protein THTE_3319 [Thermogutta terrifontis]
MDAVHCDRVRDLRRGLKSRAESGALWSAAIYGVRRFIAAFR